jgi:acyl-CoA thioesterase-1
VSILGHTLHTLQNLEDKKPQCIIAYGTSLTAGGVWVDALRSNLSERYPELVTVMNSAQGGMWSEWGVDNLEDLVLVHQPDMVFIEFAINDAYLPYSTGIEECKERLESMIDRIKETNSSCDIILMTMNPPFGDPLKVRPRFEEYYDVYRTVAKERNLSLIDHCVAWKTMLEQDEERRERWIPDGVHPTSKGQKAVTIVGIERFLFTN